MLTIKNLSAGYDGADVVHDVSLEFESGSAWCILGPNGCGKTTLVRAISHLIDFRGEVLIDGQDIRKMRRRDIAGHIAVMSQVTQVYFPYTVYETVMLGRYRHGAGRASAKDKAFVEKCLETVNLSAQRDRRIDTLSGGQRQRVFLAQTLAQDPEIILLDEPTNHLDVKHQLELIDYLKEWAAQDGHTVVGVLHDVNLALRLTDRVVFMQDGRIGRIGRFGEIADAQYLRELFGTDIAGYMRGALGAWEDIK